MNNTYLQNTYAPDSLNSDKELKKTDGNKLKNLGYMEFNFVINTHLNKNALMIKT